MSKSIAVFIGLGLLVALVLFSMTFTVNFNEVAIKTRFAKADSRSIVKEPGLHFKLPLIADKVTKIDTRLQLRESPMETIHTADGQQVLVRAFMMWRVETEGGGPLDFANSYPSGVEEANAAIVDQFRTAMSVGLSRYTFDDLIGPQSRLQEAEAAIMTAMQGINRKGIKPVTIGISQLVLPAKTSLAVLDRMTATRNKIADSERIKGQSQATGIESRARAQAEKIKSFANQRAAEIRAAGSEAATKYLTQMNEEPGLAVFLTWLDALESTLSSHTTVVMPTAFSPFHLFDFNTPTDSQGIPIPTAGYRNPVPNPSTVTEKESEVQAEDARTSAESRRGNGSTEKGS